MDKYLDKYSGRVITGIDLTKLAYSKSESETLKPEIMEKQAWEPADLKDLLAYVFTQKDAERLKARMRLTNLLGNKAKINKDTIISITYQILQYYEVTYRELIATCIETGLIENGACFCRDHLYREYDQTVNAEVNKEHGYFRMHGLCAFPKWLHSIYPLEIKDNVLITCNINCNYK